MSATVEELVAAILPRLGRVEGAGDNVGSRCPFDDHEDKSASFSFSKKNGLWMCHGCGRKGNAYQLTEALGLLSASRRRVTVPAEKENWGLDAAMKKYGVTVTPTATVFPVLDHDGNKCRRHARLHKPKPDKGRFQFWDKGKRTYHALVAWDLVREWGAGAGIGYLCEGNRDWLTLAAFDWPAIGVLGVDHFNDAMKDITKALKDSGIGALVLTPDNDIEGMKAVSEWAPKLEALGFAVGVRTLPQIINNVPVKDTYDAFNADRAGFDELMFNLPVFWRGD